MVVPGTQPLEQGLQAVLALGGSAAAGRGAAAGAREAFQALQRGVNRLSGHPEALRAFLLDVPAEHRSQLLGFIADIAHTVPIYKRQAAVVLAALLSTDGWLEAVQADAELLLRLREADVGMDVLLPVPEASEVPLEEQAAPATVDPVPAPTEAALAAAAAPSQGPDPGPASSPKTPLEADPAALRLREAQAAAAKTQQLLREAFKAMDSIGYEVDTRDATIGAFNKLSTAVNRAHWEHDRRKRGEAVPELGSASNSPAAASEAGGSSPPRLNSGSGFGEDPLVESLQGFDPKQVIRFLFALQKAYPLHRKRAVSVGHMLAQISLAFGDAVRSDSFLAAWLGAVRSADDPAGSISYGLASSLRWAAWDLGWYFANVRRRDEKAAQRDRSLFESRRREVLCSVELPRAALEPLLAAAEAAAEHTAQVRFPDESQRKGLMGNIMGVLGLMGDEGPLKDAFHRLVDEAVATGALMQDLADNIRWMIWNLAWYAANKAKGTMFGSDATDSLVRAERHFGACFRGEAKWRGVNLGGWFLLEPGPCENFWVGLPPEAQAAACEWGCCEALGSEMAPKVLATHRATYYGKEDFQRMRAAGITHVRLPFGAWCVAGPRPGEPYVGPCLQALDRALDQLEDAGLMVLLDLHGPVGGVSSEAPTGHQDANWRPEHFDTVSSLAVLKTVAERYANRFCVCGLGVANEPAESLSAKDLARYYEDAVRTTRQAGMRPGQVTVLLPIFTERRLTEFKTLWEEGYPKYEDTAFDVHFYQCFGPLWSCLPLRMQLQKARERAQTLQCLPACSVTEWSLCLPPFSLRGLDAAGQKKAWQDFAQAQLEAYDGATHGWFFWTWKDGNHKTWSMRDCLEEGLLRVPAPAACAAEATPTGRTY